MKLFRKTGHRIKIQPCDSYQMEEHENNLIPFDQFQLTPYPTNYKSKSMKVFFNYYIR
jgi:hypothetical protein